MLKAVIFDMDGVLIDSEPLHAQAAVMALQQYNIDIFPEYCSNFIGSTPYYMCQKMIEEFQLKVSPEELLQLNYKIKGHLVEEHGYPAIPYVTDLVKDLYDHGIILMIASSSPPTDIEYVLDSLSIRPYFKGYISGMEVSRPKPAPDIFLEAVKRLGVKPEECIIIEDSMHGVNAAYAAGITSIGFVNPNSGKQDLSKSAILVEGFDEVDFDFIQMVYQASNREGHIIITTNRLIIKELPIEDVKVWCQLCEDPGIKKYLFDYTGSVDTETKKHEAYIRAVYGYYGYGLWGVYLKEDNQLIGRCGIEYKSIHGFGEFELSYMLGKDYQNMGYAKETVLAIISYFFEKHDSDQIIAVIDKENIASQIFAQKIGMKQYGTITRDHRECYLYRIKNNTDQTF